MLDFKFGDVFPLLDFIKSIPKAAFDKHDTKVYINDAIKFILTLKFEPAIGCINKAIKLNKSDEEILLSLYLLKVAAFCGQLGEAQQGMEFTNKNFGQKRDTLSTDCQRISRRALNLVDEAISIDPRNANAYFLKGVTYYLSLKIDEALRSFDSALEFHPDKYLLINTLDKKSKIYLLMERRQDALKCCEEIIEIDPGNAKATSMKERILSGNSIYIEIFE